MHYRTGQAFRQFSDQQVVLAIFLESMKLFVLECYLLYVVPLKNSLSYL